MNEYEFLLHHRVRQRELEQQAEDFRQTRNLQPRPKFRWTTLHTILRRLRPHRREKLIFETDCG